MKRFLKYMLSDSTEVSVKRFIGLVSFAVFVTVIFVALFKNISVQTVPLLRDAIKYLFGIVMTAILCIGAVDIFRSLTKKDAE